MLTISDNTSIDDQFRFSSEISDSITGKGKIAELVDVDAGIDVEDRLDVKHEEVKKYNDYLESDMSEEDSKEYWRQVTESDGHVFGRYIPYAKLAIENYNLKNKTSFKFRCVEKIKKKTTQHDELFIAFQATDHKVAPATKTFEANVIHDTSGYISGQPKVIIEDCRLKATTNQVDNS